MAFTKIVESDLTGKGVTGLPDTPGLSTTAMQEKFDELSIDVVVPKHNGLIDELEADTAAASLGAVDANGNPSTVQAELNYIKEGGYTKEEADALLALKVDKEDGKGLSQYDFSQGYKDKLDGIEDNANNYVLPAGTQSTLGGVMGDGTTFTIDSNGVGHAVGGGGGTADYNALVNKPEINGVEVIGTKESEDYGILRPYLLITSDAGSTVTIKKGTTIIPATQVTGSTTQWEVCPTSYGTWTVKSALAGADDASATVTVDAVKTYDVTVSHISATITATYPVGATYCTCSKGSTVYTATSNPQTFTVHSLGTWTVETEIDGIVKSATATISADGDSQSVTIEFAEIEVTYASAFEGEVVTCTDGVSTYTKTAPVGGSTLSFAIPNTGTWTVSATAGGTLYTYSVSVVAYTTYTVAMATFSATITVTFPYSEGASCSITDGVTTLTATSSPMAFNIPNTGSWQATAVLDGVSKAGQSITITTDGQTETDTIEYGEIDLTYDNEFRGASITCVNGGTTITKTAPSGANAMTFYPPTTGTWVISGTYSGTPYSTNATISSLSTPVSASLQTLPNGKTITPTDDMQIWLACGQISGKSYTTLAEVLADTETYTRLLSDSNACDYMARSTTWASTLCADAQGMFQLGKYDYACDALLADSTWASAICNSPYFESVLDVKVPTMTSNTTPSGECIKISEGSSYPAFKAFDNDSSTWWNSQSATAEGVWVGYDFGKKVEVPRVDVQFGTTYYPVSSVTFKIQGSNDAFVSDIHDLTNSITDDFTTPAIKTYVLSSVGEYRYYRVILSDITVGTTYKGNVARLQFYGRHEAHAGKVIHTAYGNETVYYMNGGSPVTVCTATNGVGTFNLPAGTYTLYSTTAKDPDNLTDDYSKTVTITDNTTDIYLMPDNALYWWGYESSDLEDCTSANGWGIGGVSVSAPTHNTTSIAETSSASAWQGVGSASDKDFSGITKIHSIYSRSGNWCSRYLFSSKSVTAEEYNDSSSSGIVHTEDDVSTVTGNRYITVFGKRQGGTVTLYALWYE